VSMSADGSRLVAANNRGNIFAWKTVKTGATKETDYQPLFQMRAHNKYITKCLISPDTKYYEAANP
jgi:G protein beta subunit-like protein